MRRVLLGSAPPPISVDVFVIETGLIATLRGDAPEFADIVIAMKKRGFALHDIVNITRRPLDRAMAQMDAVVVPEMSPLCFERRVPIPANGGAASSTLSGSIRCIGRHG